MRSLSLIFLLLGFRSAFSYARQTVLITIQPHPAVDGLQQPESAPGAANSKATAVLAEEQQHARKLLQQPASNEQQAVEDFLGAIEVVELNDTSRATQDAMLPPMSAHPAAPAAVPLTTASGPGRRLLASAPSLCGILGTYLPNLDESSDGSMFGFSVAPNSDGSMVAVGAPMNVPTATTSGAAMVLSSISSQTCVYNTNKLYQVAGSYRYFGAQVALSQDSSTLAVMDGVEGVKTGTAQGNRPVVHVYKKNSAGTYAYFQKLNCQPRKAMASAMALSMMLDGSAILVSFSVAEGYTDKRGSAQVFVMNSTKYTYLQDLALLNMPAGASVQFGASSAISANGMAISVGTADSTNSYYKYTYMYRKDTYTGTYRIVSAISHGEWWGDTWTAGRGVGLTDDNAVAISQTGRFVLRVENGMLVVYEWSGTGMSMVWKRRCQLSAPDGYTFRTTGAALTIMETSNTVTKFAAGAYFGLLDNNPSAAAVFLYYMNSQVTGSCPYRPARKHVHNDPYSNYGAAVSITANGKLLLVGAPSAWDNNMEKQYGAVYAVDISTVTDDGTVAMTVTAAANTKAGCIAGKDANGNPCTTQAPTVTCRDVTKRDGSVVHYGAAGCTPVPAPANFWTSSGTGVYDTSTLSAYTTVTTSTKGGVVVPVGTTSWLSSAISSAVNSAYYGTSGTVTPTTTVTGTGWPTSASAALGGVPATTTTGNSAATRAATVGILSSLFSGATSIFSRMLGGAGTAAVGSGSSAATTGTTSLQLPAGAVITNPGVLTG